MNIDYWKNMLKKIEELSSKKYIAVIGTNAEYKRIIRCCRIKGYDVHRWIYFTSALEFIGKFDVINAEDIYILIEYMPDMYKQIGILNEFGVNSKQIHYVYKKNVELNRKMDAYDVTLGFTRRNGNGFDVLGDINKARYKILILGNSTSVVGMCNEKSWVEFFYEKCKEIESDVALICGGMFFNNSWQELLRLERDGIYFNPNLVISYSGVCNIDVNYKKYLNADNPYIWNYQEALVWKLIKKKKIRCSLGGNYIIRHVSVGVKKENFSYAKWWVDTVRMMKGVCTEFNIPFLGFLQPNLYIGNPICSGNEHIGGADEAYMQQIRDWYAEVRKYVQGLSYIYDFSDIFDGEENVYWDTCHVYEKGNRIIADKIFDKVGSFLKM